MHCLHCELTHHFDHSFFPANKSELEEQVNALNLSKEGLDHLANLEPDEKYYYKSVQEVLGFQSLQQLISYGTNNNRVQPEYPRLQGNH